MRIVLPCRKGLASVTAFDFGFRACPILSPVRTAVPPSAAKPSVYFFISSIKSVFSVVPPHFSSALLNACGYGFPKSPLVLMSHTAVNKSRTRSFSKTRSACSDGAFVSIIFGMRIDSRKGRSDGFSSSSSASYGG